MTLKECFKFGHIAKQIGNQNELLFALDVENPRNYKDIKFVFVEINKTLVPFFITKLQVRPSAMVVGLEDVNTPSELGELLKKDLYLPIKLLAPEESENIHQLVGYEVSDEKYGKIGLIEAVLDFTHQAVFQIQHGDREILIPAVDEFIVTIDQATKTIYLDTPEGLIDIYME
jgi:16S rRNA processing protein RimM